MLWDILNEIVFWIADGIEDFMEERNIKLNIVFRILFNIFLVVITGGIYGWILLASYVNKKRKLRKMKKRAR